MMAEQPWYSVRCVFRHPRKVYEERITIWRAGSLEEAVRLAEDEAARYATDNDVEYVGFAQAFHMFVPELEPGAEVFSLLRDSDLEADDYVSQFFDTGAEHELDSSD